VYQSGLQLVPGSQGLVNTLNEALSISNAIGFPVILKAKAGGGGMCLLVCRNSSDLSECFISARERATVSMIVDTLVEAESTFPSHCFITEGFLLNDTTLQHVILKSKQYL
jgi:biotin carboxylase